MLKRKNYYGAQSAYSRVINQLKEEEKNIGFLMIDEKAKHRALIEMYARAYNNLGVAYYNLSRSSADADKISSAMICFSKAGDYSDLLSRDRDSAVRDDVPEFSESAEAYKSRINNNIIDEGGLNVFTDYDLPHYSDDIDN